MQGQLAFGNAGVMLLNVAAMRRTHDTFVNWTFQDKHLRKGLSFAQHGPLDQGAYNAFYQGRFDVHKSPKFNWKPYWGHAPGVKMLHFHGPKPREYLSHRAKEGHDNLHMLPLLRKCDRAGQGCYKFVNMWQAVAYVAEVYI